MACVYVSALGNWSHKSNGLSEVVVGLLGEHGEGGQDGGMEGERKRGRASVIHVLSPNAISPECQRDARWGR